MSVPELSISDSFVCPGGLYSPRLLLYFLDPFVCPRAIHEGYHVPGDLASPGSSHQNYHFPDTGIVTFRILMSVPEIPIKVTTLPALELSTRMITSQVFFYVCQTYSFTASSGCYRLSSEIPPSRWFYVPQKYSSRCLPSGFFSKHIFVRCLFV